MTENDSQPNIDSIVGRIVPGRRIKGMSAILLPFLGDGSIDWRSFAKHIERTVAAGLTPAINMDTGYANLIDAETRKRALELAQSVTAGNGFVAGAYVRDRVGDELQLDAYRNAIEEVQTCGGLPILFQSYGLAHPAGGELAVVENYRQLAAACDRFLAFELGSMFAPFGAIYSLATYEALLGIPECIGAKHSSLERSLEWQRLVIRDRVRPDFWVLTGNDLAIDMVMYGSDYLLGLSTFCPDLFARRDQLWLDSDPAFFQLNDALQYLGCFAFRHPTPAYKHSAAMFLKLRGWIETDRTHPQSPTRPAADQAVLVEMAQQLQLDFKLS